MSLLHITTAQAVGGADASNSGEVRDTAAIISTAGAEDHDDDNDDDDDAAPPGVLLRTDYSAGSDEAWASFCGTLRDAEREFLADQQSSSFASAPDDDGDVEMAPAPASHSPVPAGEGSGDDDDEGEGEEGGAEGEENELALFSLVSDSVRFDGISNLRALRLLFDVSVRAAPAPPSPLDSSTRSGSSSSFAHPQHQPKQKQQQQKRHQHRLTCQRGLQETYDARGRTLWIFDARSRSDGCARLVSEAGDVATLAYRSSFLSLFPYLTHKILVGEIAGPRARRTWLNCRRTLPRVHCASTLVDLIDGTMRSVSGICAKRTWDILPLSLR